jgi:DNA-binding beta-propeller fold protein YncE
LQTRIDVLGRNVVAVGIALLVGCGGSQSPFGAMPQGGTATAAIDHSGSWMLPEAQGDDLLYVGGNDDAVTVYSFRTGKLVGIIENSDFLLPSGECVDPAGDVFITDLGRGKIFEYKHAGTKPIETLQAATDGPAGCAVDPETGNLAVTTLGDGDEGGNVAIYAHAKGEPTTYSDPDILQYYLCAYDDKGNLYVDGQHALGSNEFRFAELRKGSSAFTNITLNRTIGWPGGVLWDGKYVVIGDQDAADVYEFAIMGKRGTLKATTPINGANDVHEFWIADSILAGGDHLTNEAQYWRYPTGGSSIKTIKKDVGGPDGLTISRAPK